jgi:hypothetical protein
MVTATAAGSGVRVASAKAGPSVSAPLATEVPFCLIW